jgi:hypothetical protein
MNMIRDDLTNDEYRAHRKVSNSMLSDLAVSPFHCWALNFAPDRPKRKETPSMKIGTLAHCAILEPDMIDARYVIAPDDLSMQTKAGKEWAAAQTRIIITQDMMDAAQAQRAVVMAAPEIASILNRPGKAETSVFWTDEETGLECMCRPDWVGTLTTGEAVILDLKTTADAMPSSFGKSVASFGYHRQAAHYTAGLQANGVDVAMFLFAVVTNSYPYIAAPYVLDADSAAQGEEEIAELLALYAQCSRTNHWPAFGPGYQVASLPRWAKRELNETLEISYDD